MQVNYTVPKVIIIFYFLSIFSENSIYLYALNVLTMAG